jgi:2-dehydro-3-deoxygluconokinase
MAPLAAASGLLIGNPGAFTAMLGVTATDGDDESTVAAACRHVHEELGCARVAVTRRAVHSASRHGWHAYLYHAASSRLLASRAYDVQVVDRVGGGDSFAAGLLHAYREGRADEAALEFATAASAIKLTIPGDVNRASADDVDRLLAARR